MGQVYYAIYARDATGLPKPGLTPTWVFWQRLDTGATIAPPAISEVGHGQYKVAYDPEVSGEATGQLDLGAVITDPRARYVDLTSYRSDSRVNFNLDTPVSTRMAATISQADLTSIATTTANTVTPAVVNAIKPLIPAATDPNAIASLIKVPAAPPAAAVDVSALAAALGPMVSQPHIDTAAIAAAIAAAMPSGSTIDQAALTAGILAGMKAALAAAINAILTPSAGH